jgi:excinuclease ABC subunit C
MVAPPIPLADLPTSPGCYIYKDESDMIIYIGKAKNLRKRVASYFQKEHDDPKTTALVESIVGMDYIVTNSETESLLLEARLIRQHRPKYNINLKYGVRYAWIVLTNEEFPRLLTARSQNYDGEYFGPFINGLGRKLLLDVLRKKFYIRTCRTLPNKPCLRYHINICKAPCVGKQSVDDYAANVEKVRMYLQGKNKTLIKQLEEEMRVASQETNFELAQIRKEQVEALEYLQERILTENSRLDEEDVINYQRFNKSGKDKVKFLVFNYRRGILKGKEEFIVDDQNEVLDEFVKRYYDTTPAPKIVILPHELRDATIGDFLSEQAGRVVELRVPQKGIKKELLDLAAKNLNAKFDEADLLAQEIKRELELDHEVRTIECFDISHLQGSNMVGSMVQFHDGKPFKSNYRRFKINTVQGIDDFRAMYEVVTRRYARLKEARAKFPDLIIIDGGAIQLEFAQKAMRELGLEDIPMVGLAKKLEELYFPGEKDPRRWPKSSRMMRCFIAARDEAHRFGITYHRLLRKKKSVKDT